MSRRARTASVGSQGGPARPRVAAIVLAGGRSTRFGTDKLAATLDGRPLLHHALTAVAAVADEIVLVLSQDGPVPRLPPGLPVPLRVARDAERLAGPLAGLSAGLTATDAPLAIALGGDMPRLPAAVGRLLIEAMDVEAVDVEGGGPPSARNTASGPGEQPGAASMPVPEAAVLVEGATTRPLPVALRRAAALAAAERVLAAGERSLRALLDVLAVTAIPESRWRPLDPAGDALRDVDRPEDLAEAGRLIVTGSNLASLETAPDRRPPGFSRFWSRFWPLWYRGLARFDGLIERVWHRTGLGDTVRVRLVGRRTGLTRRVFLGLLEVDGRFYLGHPDGHCAWTLNLEAAAEATIERADGSTLRVRAVSLPPGPERDRAIGAAFRQHPFPGNAMYRLAAGHVRAIGRFYRVEAIEEPAAG